MSSPLIRHTDTTLLLRPAYCGSVDYYALMASYANVVVDYSSRFNKRLKDTHRFSILGTGGVHELTAPLDKTPGMSQQTWSEIRLSRHGEWWRLHWAAIYSAYGRTPFFEFYEDDFKSVFLNPASTLQEHNLALDAVIRSILDISASKIDMTTIEGDILDFRTIPIPQFPEVSYYQVWSSRHGFTPHLSILDLIFNMGPESPLILNQMLRQVL